MNILFFLTPKSEVAYLYEDYTIRQALEKMEHRRYSAIPVLNREGEYVSTITEGDLLWAITRKYDFNMAAAEKESIKTIKQNLKVHPVRIDEKIENLIMKSMNQNFVPVIDDKKKFIGIVTRKDIIQYCSKKLQQYENGENTVEEKRIY